MCNNQGGEEYVFEEDPLNWCQTGAKNLVNGPHKNKI